MTINLSKIILIWAFILFLSGIVSSRPNTKICRNRNGKFPRSGTSCKGYYDCKNFVPQEKTCGDGQHFNANKGWCDWEELYPCLEKQKDKECLRENGLFLKPGTDCRKYYRCCNGKAKEEICPGDTLFDSSKGNCEWPDLFTCTESLSTTEKVSSTVTTFSTSTPPDDQKEKTPTAPAVSTNTVQETTKSKRITYSTQDPDFERTNSKILETTTKINTQPTLTDDPLTSQSSETSTISETITSTTAKPTAEISTTSQSTKIGSSTLQPTTIEQINEISTTLSTTTEMSTSHSTTESSTSQSTTEISTSQSTTETSTLQQTSSESTIISQTISPQMSSTHSTDHTIFKENKERELTKPTIFETTVEVTLSPSTAEVTPFDESNIMCPEPNGYFPHPLDKHKFVGCVNNIPSILTCPSNLVYKHRLRRCDYE